MLTKEDT